MPNFYLPPLQTPLYWRDETSGELPAAVTHFFDWCLGHAPDETAEDLGIVPLTEAEITLLREFIVYFIHAPCWENNLTGNEEMLADLRELQTRAKAIASVEGLRRWIDEAMDLGLDPF